VKIAIDARRVNDFGVGTYIRNVFRALARLDTADEYFLLGRSDPFHEFDGLPANF